MIGAYAATLLHVLARVFLEMVLPFTAVIVTAGIVAHRKYMIINWRGGGVTHEMKLARCVKDGRPITRCTHDLGAHESTWEHYDDSTHLHDDGTPVTHR